MTVLQHTHNIHIVPYENRSTWKCNIPSKCTPRRTLSYSEHTHLVSTFTYPLRVCRSSVWAGLATSALLLRDNPLDDMTCSPPDPVYECEKRKGHMICYNLTPSKGQETLATDSPFLSSSFSFITWAQTCPNDPTKKTCRAPALRLSLSHYVRNR